EDHLIPTAASAIEQAPRGDEGSTVHEEGRTVPSQAAPTTPRTEEAQDGVSARPAPPRVLMRGQQPTKPATPRTQPAVPGTQRQAPAAPAQQPPRQAAPSTAPRTTAPAQTPPGRPTAPAAQPTAPTTTLPRARTERPPPAPAAASA